MEDIIILYIFAARTFHNLYDIQGRRLTTQPRRGIYVKDGKKVVVK